MTDKNYKVVGYKLNIPVLGQTKLTHRDRELVRRIDSLRRVPRAELAKVFNVSEREIYKALEVNQASVRLPALTDKRRQQSVDLIAEGHSNTDISKMTGLTAATVNRIRRSLLNDAEDS